MARAGAVRAYTWSVSESALVQTEVIDGELVTAPPTKENKDYRMVGDLELSDLVLLSKGFTPSSWRKQRVTGNLIRIARYFLHSKTASAREIDDRLYGPVTQKTEVSGAVGFKVVIDLVK